MHRIQRLSLSQTTLDKLAEITDEINSDADPKAKAQQKWKTSTDNQTFVEISEKLKLMSPGLSRCMYCEDSHGTDIEHFWPKGNYPLGAFWWENYLLACSFCNSNLKREEFPLDAHDQPELIDPTAEDPSAHLFLTPTNGKFAAIGPKGAPTIRVFGLNDGSHARNLPQGRQNAYESIQALLILYNQLAGTNPDRANRIKQAVCEHPFSAVFHWLIRISQLPNALRLLDPTIIAIIQRHGVAAWL